MKLSLRVKIYQFSKNKYQRQEVEMKEISSLSCPAANLSCSYKVLVAMTHFMRLALETLKLSILL